MAVEMAEESSQSHDDVPFCVEKLRAVGDFVCSSLPMEKKVLVSNEQAGAPHGDAPVQIHVNLDGRQE
jgi:hypothetical protein